MTRESLERMYENELAYLRKLGMEFARQRPKIADRLSIDRASGAATDPHVERLIEACAFLTARIRHKLDDEFPELTEALLGTLYPHYLAPVPSMAIVQFDVDPERGKLPEGHKIARHSRLFSRDVEGLPCRFRTAYPVQLWPIEVVDARYQAVPFGKDITVPGKAQQCKAMVRIELRSAPGIKFSELKLDQLRFFLSGDDPLVHKLYELVFNHVTNVTVRGGVASGDTTGFVQEASCLQPVGFGTDEGLLPYANRSFVGYRLLTEYFSFPQKYLFFDVTGLAGVRGRPISDKLEILLFLNRAIPHFETQVRTDTFRLGCAPIVNLFEQEADPIHLSYAKTEYHVLPDVRNHWAMEVYSIDAVQSHNLETHEVVNYNPFYAFKHADRRGKRQAYWHLSRRPSVRKDDPGTEVYLSFVDTEFNPVRPAVDIVTLKTLCSNRDLPGKLRAAGGEDWGFQFEGQAPLKQIVPLVKPTGACRVPFDELRWRLVSHLSLNHLSITDDEDGADALREILKIYDYTSESQQRISTQHIDGIRRVNTRRKVAPICDGTVYGFCRGLEITVEFEEENYAGTSVFLLASVLERFMALYASINSATRLVAKFTKRDGIFKQWPFRAGDQRLA